MPELRYFISIAILILAAGVGALAYSHRLPVYTDAKAVERMTEELYHHPEATRTEEWYDKLESYETPRKRLSDLGTGVMASGIGLFLSLVFWSLYHRERRMRRVRLVISLWMSLWLLRLPFTGWYYFTRAMRGDYPPWADSIAIPIISQWIVWIIGGLLSSLILQIAVRDHPLPAVVQFTRAPKLKDWILRVLIGTWILFLAWYTFEQVIDGDEGGVITCTIAIVFLLIFLSASEVSPAASGKSETSHDASAGDQLKCGFAES